jgi:hydrogenase maturation factor
MLHAGFAIQKVDEEEARETMRLLREVAGYSSERDDEIH